MKTYCYYCNSHPDDASNKEYHDTWHGFSLKDNDERFIQPFLKNVSGL